MKKEDEDFEIKKEAKKEEAKEKVRESENQKIDIGEKIGDLGVVIVVLVACYLVFGDHAGSFKNKLSEKTNTAVGQVQEWLE